MTRPFLDLNTPKAIRNLMGPAATAAPHYLPMLDAAARGVITLMVISDRCKRLPQRRLDRYRLPTILLLGDDDHADTGPVGWRCAREAAGWAAAAIVHGAAGKAADYAEAVAAAVALRRLLFVETASRHVQAWGALMPGKPVLHLVPELGSHPVMPVKGDLH